MRDVVVVLGKGDLIIKAFRQSYVVLLGEISARNLNVSASWFLLLLFLLYSNFFYFDSAVQIAVNIWIICVEARLKQSWIFNFGKLDWLKFLSLGYFRHLLILILLLPLYVVWIVLFLPILKGWPILVHRFKFIGINILFLFDRDDVVLPFKNGLQLAVLIVLNIFHPLM